MPALSPTMTQGNLAAWKKAEGEEIAAGDVIAEVETDKATVDYEVVDDGIIAKILVPEGAQDIAVGTPLAVVVDDAADVGAFKDFTAPASGGAAAPEPAPAAAAPAAAAPAAAALPPPPAAPPPRAAAAGRRGRAAAARWARRRRPRHHSPACGHGPRRPRDRRRRAGGGGRAAGGGGGAGRGAAGAPAYARPAPGEAYLDIPHSNIRKVVARRMVENKNGEVPHYYLTMEVGMAFGATRRNSAQFGALRSNSRAILSHAASRDRWAWTS